MHTEIGRHNPPDALRKFPQTVDELWARAGSPAEAGEWMWELTELIRSETADLGHEMDRGLPTANCRNLMQPIVHHSTKLTNAVEAWLDHIEDHSNNKADYRCGSLAGRTDMESIWRPE